MGKGYFSGRRGGGSGDGTDTQARLTAEQALILAQRDTFEAGESVVDGQRGHALGFDWESASDTNVPNPMTVASMEAAGFEKVEGGGSGLTSTQIATIANQEINKRNFAAESAVGTHLGAVATYADLPYAGVAPPANDPVSPGDTVYVVSLRVEYVRQGDNTWSLRPGSKSMQQMGQAAPDFPSETFEGLRHETLDGRIFYADASLNWNLVGTAGPQGSPGKSAYELAVDNGYVGTEQQWLNSLGAIQ